MADEFSSAIFIFKTMTYDSKYSGSEYYWGKEPTVTCRLFLDKIKLKKNGIRSLLDLGCGEGRDAVHFARHEYDVTGVDISKNGLAKTDLLAKEFQVSINTIEADIKKYQLKKLYDVIFSSGTLHYLPPKKRKERFEHLKKMTKISGYNAFSVFVEKPFIAKAPDAEKEVFLFQSGELMSYYHDWEIIYITEEIHDCNSGGVEHKHAANRIIARKPSS